MVTDKEFKALKETVEARIATVHDAEGAEANKRLDKVELWQEEYVHFRADVYYTFQVIRRRIETLEARWDRLDRKSMAEHFQRQLNAMKIDTERLRIRLGKSNQRVEALATLTEAIAWTHNPHREKDDHALGKQAWLNLLVKATHRMVEESGVMCKHYDPAVETRCSESPKWGGPEHDEKGQVLYPHWTCDGKDTSCDGVFETRQPVPDPVDATPSFSKERLERALNRGEVDAHFCPHGRPYWEDCPWCEGEYVVKEKKRAARGEVLEMLRGAIISLNGVYTESVRLRIEAALERLAKGD